MNYKKCLVGHFYNLVFLLKKVMKEGDRGIIFGDRGIFKRGHVFNVIKKDGNLFFIDGQSGTNANLKDGFISFKYLKTN